MEVHSKHPASALPRRNILSAATGNIFRYSIGTSVLAAALSGCATMQLGGIYFVLLRIENDRIEFDRTAKIPKGTKRIVFVLTTPGWALRFDGPDNLFNTTPVVWTEGDTAKTRIAAPWFPGQPWWFVTTKVPKPGNHLNFEVAAKPIKEVQNKGSDKEIIILAEGGIGGSGCIES